LFKPLQMQTGLGKIFNLGLIFSPTISIYNDYTGFGGGSGVDIPMDIFIDFDLIMVLAVDDQSVHHFHIFSRASSTIQFS
jgi:hypothetical protein